MIIFERSFLRALLLKNPELLAAYVCVVAEAGHGGISSPAQALAHVPPKRRAGLISALVKMGLLHKTAAGHIVPPHPANRRPTGDQQAANRRPTDDQQEANRRPTGDQQTANRRPTDDQQAANRQPTDDRQQAPAEQNLDEIDPADLDELAAMSSLPTPFIFDDNQSESLNKQRQAMSPLEARARKIAEKECPQGRDFEVFFEQNRLRFFVAARA